MRVAAVLALIATLLTGIVSHTAAEDAPKRLLCEPKSGLSVADVKGTGDLGDCRFAANAQDVADPDREVEVLVDYPQSTGGSVRRENLGMNEWNGDQLDLPDTVPAGAWLVLHGDAWPQEPQAGGCVVMVFGPGETVEGYSQGTFQAVLLTMGSGDSDRIDEIGYLKEVAELEAVNCPVMRAPAGVDLPVENAEADAA